MERESFENDEVAEVLNKGFVSIKVDREERPDIDHVYMEVCQALTGQGGWPLTIVMTPDKQPFFAGTYFPKSARYGRPGLMEILDQLLDKWQNDRKRILETGGKIVDAMKPRFAADQEGELSEATAKEAYQQYKEQFDNVHGGFGNAPKFPSPHHFSFLLRYWKMSEEKNALEMVEHSLQAMYRGGIYDHIGFGFARYSTDEQWLVPHFEKMLYDNALLAVAYTETYQVTGNPFYKQVVEEIFTYVLRDMISPEGAFYSAQDADSEGVEGKFYVFQPQEIYSILGEKLGSLFCMYFDITPQGNFEEYTSIPNLIRTDVDEFLQQNDLSKEEWSQLLMEMRTKVFKAREQRIHPHKDDKVLTAWNGLMIASLAKAAQVFQKEEYAKAAEQAFTFIMETLRREDGRLLARYRDGEAAVPAFVDDYAFVAWGALELFAATWDVKYLRAALELSQSMIDLFWDMEHGGFFFNGTDSETLFARPKEIYDGAMPSGNSVAALNLLRLARLTSDFRLEETAQKQLQAFAGNVSHYPFGYAHFLTALQFALSTSQEVVLAGAKEQLQPLIQALQTAFLPATIVLVKTEGQQGLELSQLVPAVSEQNAVDGQPTAYVCENFACHAPVTTLDNLMKQLNI